MFLAFCCSLSLFFPLSFSLSLVLSRLLFLSLFLSPSIGQTKCNLLFFVQQTIIFFVSTFFSPLCHCLCGYWL